MEERTRAYLRGRFGDYYRRAELTPPPDTSEREWGYIPWTSGPGTTMVRHRSLLDLGSIDDFLARERPRHVYFSAGRYDDPSASSMGEKGWRSSDLVFDLDADHLPSVSPGEDTYAEMLAACKDALVRLLDFLESDFGFEDLTVVFSGSRGYHVHVRDRDVRRLDRQSRREIVDYVRGIGLEFDALVEEEAVGGTAGRSSPAHKRTLPTEGGWGGRAHEHIVATVEELLALEESEAIERLTEYEGIGDGKAEAALRAMGSNTDQLRAGNVDIHPAFLSVAKALVKEVVERDDAPIDEPVTTDTNRLIRLPGSLHGGSGLAVRRIDRDELSAFDPLVDAVPETFVGHEITVDVSEEVAGELNGDSFTFSEGVHSVPEYLGVFLMARGRAEKGQE
ncbi:Eukaryotic-type DNA primase, catalytic (small) subunit [Halapricum desulfuricans]|uniref:DNA primase small subunit PriS n=1 Tax=Halapricum desulfuricans TaxID=2841257 RepID=A0A897NG23_9EURY|nr:DNA primase small subunit PriS [Halapricum desulfuricans]QSG11652.1 Eukaryotic-type DNA primase, catalytic (small) subunit [Halapricum desulfuricans]